MSGVRGRRALVLCGTRGIGLGVAQALARHGAEVTLTVALPYIVFLVGEMFEVSGVVAVAVAGLTAGTIARVRLGPENWDYLERVWEQIDRIRGTGVALLVVEQNASLAMEHADSVCLLAQGRNVLSGSASELREHADVARILVG